MSDRMNDLESSLRNLKPKGDTFSADRVLYEAGRASARGWLWPMMCVCSMFLAVGLGVCLLLQPAPTVIERIVYIPLPEPVSPPEPKESPSPDLKEEGTYTSLPAMPEVPSDSYLHRRNQVVRWGMEIFPQTTIRKSIKPPLRTGDVYKPTESSSSFSFWSH